jgi:hypothetical protein
MAFWAKTTDSAGVGGNRMFASAILTLDKRYLTVDIGPTTVTSQ